MKMRARVLALLCAVLALSVGVATATAGNNSNRDAAKSCQKGGYTSLAPEPEAAAFTSEEACVSWAAEGGILWPVGIGPF